MDYINTGVEILNMNNRDNTNKKVINEEAFYKSHHAFEDRENYTTTLMLAVFFGMFGVHRFYSKKYATGVLMLLTFGGCFIWVLYDIIAIIKKEFNNKDGKRLTYGGKFYENYANIFAIGMVVLIPSVIMIGILSNQAENSKVNQVTELTQTEEQLEEIAEANAEPVEEVAGEVTEEVPALEETAQEEIPDLAETEPVYDAPQTGVAIENNEITVGNLGNEWSSEKANTIIIYGTLTNNEDRYAYSNVGFRLTFNNNDKVALTEDYTVLTDIVLKPQESKQFEVECKIKGNITRYEVNVRTADIVEVYEGVK